ncbi:MAG: amidohydrolase family protein, partial [Bryobacteraceae bacterium]|nr:amidohydrolase family protein [Bryobacteraceae bacterium]
MLSRLLSCGCVIGAIVFGQEFDVVIRNGLLADGTGNPMQTGDVGIRSGKISAIGRLSGAGAKKVIDAAGLIVSPGFIDIHNHSDFTILTDGNAESMIRQGVTSMIFGEGGSAAPIGGKQADRTAKADWTDLRGYFARVLRNGVSANIGTYVGSSQIWTYVRGSKPAPPTGDELGQMKNLVREAMQQGALGVSSSLSGPPGSWIDTDSLVAMCK